MYPRVQQTRDIIAFKSFWVRDRGVGKYRAEYEGEARGLRKARGRGVQQQLLQSTQLSAAPAAGKV